MAALDAILVRVILRLAHHSDGTCLNLRVVLLGRICRPAWTLTVIQCLVRHRYSTASELLAATCSADTGLPGHWLAAVVRPGQSESCLPVCPRWSLSAK